jgi:hypothetical protein
MFDFLFKKSLSDKLKRFDLLEVKLSALNSEINQSFRFFQTDDIEIIIKKFNKYISIIKNNTIILVDKNEHILIFNDWSNLLKSIQFIKLRISSTLTKNFDILERDILYFLNKIDKKYNKILLKFPDSVIDSSGITLFEKIEISHYYNDSGVFEFSKENKLIINKVKIYLEPNGKIAGIKLDKPHPNADKNNWYCLGTIKLKKISPDIINEIIQRIKICNLTDCYWKPKL